MYRIQASKNGHCTERWADNMTERDQVIKELIAAGYHPASISQEWLARKGY
jgi:hypothetical protein